MSTENVRLPLRILVYAPLGVGGVTGLMVNIQQKIDREKLNFDYLVVHDRIEPMEETVTTLGSRKIVASTDDIRFKPLRGLVRLFKIEKVCRENGIQILHFNGGQPVGLLTLIAARKGGVQWITFHSHNGGMSNTSLVNKIINALCKPFLGIVVDDFWACSSIAAEFSFPKKISKNKKYYFMPNAINLNKYAFNKEVREQVRSELDIEQNFVIGHAGRFVHQKNHSFLIDIFARIHERCDNAVLLLFGTGELEREIKEKVHCLDLDNYVRFCGSSDEMNRMYQGMDVFLMPSHFEGLPVTGVEAQAAGLPVVFSDVITREVGIAPNVKYVSLSESASKWADTVLEFIGQSRKDYTSELRAAGFDQDKMVSHFQEYYLDIGTRLKCR